MFGLAGIITLFGGSAVCAAAWLAGGWQWESWLERAGVALLVLTVPLLAYGAHCFDCVERESRAATKQTTTGEGGD